MIQITYNDYVITATPDSFTLNVVVRDDKGDVKLDKKLKPRRKVISHHSSLSQTLEKMIAHELLSKDGIITLENLINKYNDSVNQIHSLIKS